MNLADAFQRIRDRLDENGARPETLKLVDTIASQPGVAQAQARSLNELVRRLMRTPIAHDNVHIYDDLAVLDEQLSRASSEAAAQRAADDSKPLPKSKKYYKTLKARDKKPGA